MEIKEMAKYQLILKIPFEALDDMEARKITEGHLKEIRHSDLIEPKLQKIYEDKPPVGIFLNPITKG